MESVPNTRSGIQIWKRSNVIARAQNTLEEIHEFADQIKLERQINTANDQINKKSNNISTDQEILNETIDSLRFVRDASKKIEAGAYIYKRSRLDSIMSSHERSITLEKKTPKNKKLLEKDIISKAILKGELKLMPNVFDSIKSSRGAKKTEFLTPKDIVYLAKKNTLFVPPLQQYKNFQQEKGSLKQRWERSIQVFNTNELSYIEQQNRSGAAIMHQTSVHSQEPDVECLLDSINN